jgi:hypothetical protein
VGAGPKPTEGRLGACSGRGEVNLLGQCRGSHPNPAHMSDTDLHVEVRGELIIVSQPRTPSYAIYIKPLGQSQLVLISSDAIEDHQLRARIWNPSDGCT